MAEGQRFALLVSVSRDTSLRSVDSEEEGGAGSRRRGRGLLLWHSCGNDPLSMAFCGLPSTCVNMARRGGGGRADAVALEAKWETEMD